MVILILIAVILAVSFFCYWLAMSPYSQFLGEFPFRAKTSDKVIALSFDDGPNEPYTSDIAEFLKVNNIRATFFQVGKCVERYPDVTVRLEEQGHVIGYHSYSHEFKRCFKLETLETEFEKSRIAMNKILGKEPVLFRPPWLLRSRGLFRLLMTKGLKPVSGEFCHVLEVFQPRPERIARRALAKVRPGCILIFHDGVDGRTGYRAKTVEAVKLVVNELIERGYRFVTIDALFGIDAYKTQEP